MILTGLIGWPIGHSRSPAMHNAAFAATGIEGVYVPMAVAPSAVPAALQGLVALGFRGCNVTIPHKQAVLAHVQDLSDTARAVGAVNTLIIENGQLFGENTDVAGFWTDLQEAGMAPPELAAEGAMILGAGGAARAVAYALGSHGIPVLVLARRLAQAQALTTALQAHLPPGAILSAHPWSALAELADRPRLIVNCTPLGMEPHPTTSPWPEHLSFLPRQMAYDLVYNPPHTQFLRQARAHGAMVRNGLGMLLWQGALAWQQWTGHPPPIQAMRKALIS